MPFGEQQVGFKNSGLVIANQVIIEGTKAGLFVYNGTPALGNPPILSAVAPGTTKDKYGNTIGPAVLTIGNFGSGDYLTFDGSGDMVAHAGANALEIEPFTPSLQTFAGTANPQIEIDGSRSAIFFYNPSGGLGNLVCAIAPLGPGTDKYGNAYNGRIQEITGTGSAFLDSGDLSVINSLAGAMVVDAFVAADAVTDALILHSPQAAGHNAYILSLTGSATQPQAILSVGGNTGPGVTARPLEIFNSDILTSTGIAGIGLVSNLSSVNHIAEIYADQFGQLHTPQAFQTDINVETKNLGAPPGAGGSGPKYWGNGGHANVQSGQAGIGGDTNDYDAERLNIFLGNDQTSQNNTVAATITDGTTPLSHHVGIGQYKIRAFIGVNQEVAAGTITVSLSGPAVSSGGMSGEALDQNPTSNENWTTGGLSAQSFAMTNIGRTTKVILEGIVNFSAAGTLAVQAKTSAGADTYHCRAGSYLEIEPVTAT